MKLKTVRVPRGYDGLHCEVEGCLVNITTGLTRADGTRVVNVSVQADQYAGDPQWEIESSGHNTNDGQLARYGWVMVVQKPSAREAR